MAPAVERRERRRLVSSDRSTSPVRDRHSPHRKASSRREASPAYRKSSRISRSPDRAHRVRSPVKETSSDRIRSPKHGRRESTVKVDSSRSPSPRTKRLRRSQAETEAQGVADRERGRSSGREDNDKGRYKERAEVVSTDRKSLKEKNDAALSKSSNRDPANSPEGRSHKERRSSRSPARASAAVVRNENERKTGPAEYSRGSENDSLAKMKEAEKALEAKEKSKLKNVSGGNISDNAKCKLLHCSVDGVVAEGRIASTYPKAKVHHVPLGTSCWKVWVDRVFVEKVDLIRPNEEIFFLDDAIGSTVAWLSKFIVLCD